MRGRIKKIALFCFLLLVLLGFSLYLFARKPVPEHITYGISFNAPYTHELGLDEREVFDAFIDELGVRNLRLSAHWPLIEPRKDMYDFGWLDYQVKRAEGAGATVILGVGRRLPRWPECHIPKWAAENTWEEQKAELREYITAVVSRYKGSSAITHWQVENEPYLGMFAREHCGELDEAFLEEEIALVRSIDGTRPVLVTDSGNLGTWSGAYKNGDAFGTSVYVYFWNPDIGKFKTVLPPWFYRVKEGFMRFMYGTKDTMLIELSLEPWLLEPVADVPMSVQFSRMNPDTLNEILEYAKATRYDRQYLWGGEWWYWLKERGEPAMWEQGKELFAE